MAQAQATIETYYFNLLEPTSYPDHFFVFNIYRSVHAITIFILNT